MIVIVQVLFPSPLCNMFIYIYIDWCIETEDKFCLGTSCDKILKLYLATTSIQLKRKRENNYERSNNVFEKIDHGCLIVYQFISEFWFMVV